MLSLNKISLFDKISLIALVLTLVYWIIVKIEVDFFYFIYEMTWLLAIPFTVLLTVYFLIKWVMSKFSFKKIYLYALLLSLLALFIMRFVFVINSSGIQFMDL